MTAVDEYESLDLPAYREHLGTCPLIHLGILANCPEATRLHAARTGDELDHEPTRHEGAEARA
ncbi:hypothetical protein GCM10018785_32400 [Streptomyces longispororuber]|uniref:Uncharacterized protein n=1 Tax=Streptomyces longispororuber TaxID=68230 RepID=A0A918ZP46_9ACTN|nr:hypothetical protein [Streptomyces longispororuber]GHE60829.1 hypothetical protein GCM10018785_32400 [Streptomyces longispororuber]